MSETFFTADQCFGDLGVIHHSGRPFGSLEEMHETIVERHNRVVGTGDLVWMLGDVSRTEDLDTVLPLMKRLHGSKILVPGDSDQAWSGRASFDPDVVERYRDEGGFTSVGTLSGFLKNKIPVRVPLMGGPSHGRPVVALSHFSYDRDCWLPQGGRDEFGSWRPSRAKEADRWLLCGHARHHWCMRGNQINVGVDQWDFEPVPADVLLALIEGGPMDDSEEG